jgi:ABC-type cobalamin/Fe3+-siderophores transport system ATPase subunit
MYRPRLADNILARKLKGKGAVLIQGPKWCGKSTTCKKKANTIAANNQTVYVNSETAYTSLIKTNNGGALSATKGTDNTTGSSVDNTNKKFVAGTLAANDDASKTVALTITSARTTTVAQGTASVTVTVQKYTRTLSWSSTTPAANAKIYASASSATATASGSGGTAGTRKTGV